MADPFTRALRAARRRVPLDDQRIKADPKWNIPMNATQTDPHAWDLWAVIEPTEPKKKEETSQLWYNPAGSQPTFAFPTLTPEEATKVLKEWYDTFAVH